MSTNLAAFISWCAVIVESQSHYNYNYFDWILPTENSEYATFRYDGLMGWTPNHYTWTEYFYFNVSTDGGLCWDPQISLTFHDILPTKNCYSSGLRTTYGYTVNGVQTVCRVTNRPYCNPTYNWITCNSNGGERLINHTFTTSIQLWYDQINRDPFEDIPDIEAYIDIICFKPPSISPTSTPTLAPVLSPSKSPTSSPSFLPTAYPSTSSPSFLPTAYPSTNQPTNYPTNYLTTLNSVTNIQSELAESKVDTVSKVNVAIFWVIGLVVFISLTICAGVVMYLYAKQKKHIVFMQQELEQELESKKQDNPSTELMNA